MQKVIEKVGKLAVIGDAQAGTRVRERRLDIGLRQADLAKRVGISPSYLNLIEHNRRRIAGPLLAELGRVLDVDPTLLTQGASRSVLDQLHAAAAAAKEAPEIDRTEELAARYPGWATLVAAQQGRIAALETRIAELTDRMAHDPELATSMHAVISAVTSIRSTASILTSGERLDEDWIQRFHNNIYDDAIRLADSSGALVRYLDAPTDTDVPLSPIEEVTRFFVRHAFHIPALEKRGGSIDKVAQSANLRPLADTILRSALSEYQRLAQAMPLRAFTKAVCDTGFDPDALASKFSVSFQDVLVRRSSIPVSKETPEIGLMICDGAGFLTQQKPMGEFTLSHGGMACPLWPLFTAIGQPDRPIAKTVSLPGQQGAHFLCYAISTQTGGGLHVPPKIRSVMLMIPTQSADDQIPLALGPTCRICPREACHARREPSALNIDL